MKERSHICVLEENTTGNDYVIGDLHGSHYLLKQILDGLKSSDRLFIVGDLIDRGPGSHEICKLITRINKERAQKNLPPQIHVVRGNHEEMFLELNQLRNSAETYTPTLYPDCHEQTKKEMAWTEKLSQQEAADIKNFFESLPYIIHVTGQYPFSMVHADMPFNDEKLFKKIQANEQLTREEINYATWSRPTGDQPFQNTGRTKDDAICYVGHNILGGVRSKTNTVNLDVAAYDTGISLVANHTTGAVLVKKAKKVTDDASDLNEISKIEKKAEQCVKQYRKNCKEKRKALEQEQEFENTGFSGKIQRWAKANPIKAIFVSIVFWPVAFIVVHNAVQDNKRAKSENRQTPKNIPVVVLPTENPESVNSVNKNRQKPINTFFPEQKNNSTNYVLKFKS